MIKYRYNKEKTMAQVVVTCNVCKNYTFQGIVTAEEMDKFLNRQAFVQDIWPNMPKDTRELFISGTCPICWDSLFKNEED